MLEEMEKKRVAQEEEEKRKQVGECVCFGKDWGREGGDRHIDVDPPLPWSVLFIDETGILTRVISNC